MMTTDWPAVADGEASARRPPPQGLGAQGLATAWHELGAKGWTILRGLPLPLLGRGTATAVLEYASAFGVPSDRDGGHPVRRVAPHPGHQGTTFSSRAGDAGLHTDSQYHRVPEDLVCLLVVRPATEGGLTRLLGAGDAVSALAAQPDAERILDALAAPSWRWQVPREFACGSAVAKERGYRGASVLPGDGTIRWRRDNISGSTPGRLRAVAPIVERCLDHAEGAVTLTLDAGDMVVVDNTRTLHGRTWFDDPRRLLLRVRLWRRP